VSADTESYVEKNIRLRDSLFVQRCWPRDNISGMLHLALSKIVSNVLTDRDDFETSLIIYQRTLRNIAQGFILQTYYFNRITTRELLSWNIQMAHFVTT